MKRIYESHKLKKTCLILYIWIYNTRHHYIIINHLEGNSFVLILCGANFFPSQLNLFIFIIQSQQIIQIVFGPALPIFVLSY